jgi:signal transduction histidine kinase
MKRTRDQTSVWVFYLVTGLLAGSALLRSLYAYRGSSMRFQVLGVLAAWLILFISEKSLTSRWHRYFPIYLVLQTCMVVLLLRMPYPSDYFAALFAPLSMQIIQRFNLRIGAICIGLFALSIVVFLTTTYGLSQAIALAGIYTVVSIFLGFYALTSQRAQQARDRNQTLALELQAANQQLETLSGQLQQLGVARERQRMARDLHDSVTQSVFSMTLTSQTALLLLKRDPDRVEQQLDRLKQLAQGALSEMQVLTSDVGSVRLERGGLLTALRQYLAERQLPETLVISLEVDGSQSLTTAEENNLFYISQEAVNNIIKHANTTQACIRLHLVDPMWIEIADQGQGFDLQKARSAGRVGLGSMKERAVDIGWEFQILTSPGSGTCIRIAKKLPEERVSV